MRMNYGMIGLSLAILAFGSATTASADLVEYTAAHADIRPIYENGDLSLRYRFDTGAVLDSIPNASPTFELPSNAYVRVSDATAMTIPDFFKPNFSFLGSPIPDPVYILPQGNVSGQPFFGLSTEELEASEWSSGITYTLSAFNGPGNFALYQGAFSPSVKWQTANGVDGSDTFTPPLGHDHYFWAFTQAGVYELTVTASGTHDTDGVKSATDTFLFAVGDLTAIPEPSAFLLVGFSGVGVMMSIRRRRQC